MEEKEVQPQGNTAERTCFEGHAFVTGSAS